MSSSTGAKEGDDLIREISKGLGVTTTPPKNYSLGKDTSVRTVVYLLANLCRANNNYNEIRKMVSVMFRHLPDSVTAVTTRCDPTELAIDQFLQGFDVPQVIAAAYARSGNYPDPVYLNAAIHAAEAALVELFELHRYGSSSAAYGAMCTLASALFTYGERKVTRLARRYTELCTRVPMVHKKFVIAVEEVRKIASKNTEGANRSVDEYYSSLGGRVAEINLFVKKLRDSIDEQYPNSADKVVTEEEQLDEYNRQLAEAFKGSAKAPAPAKAPEAAEAPDASSGSEWSKRLFASAAHVIPDQNGSDPSAPAQSGGPAVTPEPAKEE